MASYNMLDVLLKELERSAELRYGSATEANARLLIRSLAMSNIKVNDYSDDHILSLEDANAYVRMNKASAVNLTVPPQTDEEWEEGTQVVIRQVGAGALTLVEGSGVTLNVLDGKSLVASAQGASITLIRTATADEWDVVGELADA